MVYKTEVSRSSWWLYQRLSNGCGHLKNLVHSYLEEIDICLDLYAQVVTRKSRSGMEKHRFHVLKVFTKKELRVPSMRKKNLGWQVFCIRLPETEKWWWSGEKTPRKRGWGIGSKPLEGEGFGGGLPLTAANIIALCPRVSPLHCHRPTINYRNHNQWEGNNHHRKKKKKI